MTYAPINTLQAYLINTKVFPDDETELRTVLTNMYTNIANATNVREIALYDLNEIITGQQFFFGTDPQKKRTTFRKVFSIGAIAAGATLNTAHGLTNVTSYTKIYGTCVTATPDYRPIPYVSTTLNQQISIRVTATNIVIVYGAGAPNITSAIVVLEYLKN